MGSIPSMVTKEFSARRVYGISLSGGHGSGFFRALQAFSRPGLNLV